MVDPSQDLSLSSRALAHKRRGSTSRIQGQRPLSAKLYLGVASSPFGTESCKYCGNKIWGLRWVGQFWAWFLGRSFSLKSRLGKAQIDRSSLRRASFWMQTSRNDYQRNRIRSSQAKSGLCDRRNCWKPVDLLGQSYAPNSTSRSRSLSHMLMRRTNRTLRLALPLNRCHPLQCQLSWVVAWKQL